MMGELTMMMNLSTYPLACADAFFRSPFAVHWRGRIPLATAKFKLALWDTLHYLEGYRRGRLSLLPSMSEFWLVMLMLQPNKLVVSF